MEPKLRVRASGLGGSGYKHPRTGEVVPGVTTVLRKLDKPGVLQWAVDNTAAYAVANIDNLLSRTEEQGYGFLRWYWKRDPLAGDLTDIRNYSAGVLGDAGELGTMMHEWVAAEHDACPYPDVTLAPDFFWELVEEWDKWSLSNTVEPMESEFTLWNTEHHYAGTADGLWKINGETVLVDVKTSRNTWDEHWMQLTALAECDTVLSEVNGDWVEEKAIKPDRLALLHMRPSDTDKNGEPMAPFAELKFMNPKEHDPMFAAFTGLLRVAHSLSDIKKIRKQEEK
jgi:hypothetical protein